MTTYLTILPTLKDNGGGAVVLSLCRSLVAKNDRVYIITSSYHGDSAIKEEKNSGIRFIITPTIGRSQLAAMFILLLHAGFYSILLRPVVIYTHLLTYCAPCFFSREKFWVAQDLEYRFFTGKKRIIFKLLLKKSIMNTKLVITSEWLKRYFSKLNARIIYSGDVGISNRYISANSNKKEREIDFLLIAKKGDHKNPQVTRKVAEILSSEKYNVTLIDQDIETSIIKKNKYLTIKEAVSAEMMQQLMGNSQVFINLPKAEGYGLTPLEALSMGCKVVSTIIPSTRFLKHKNLLIITSTTDIISSAVTEGKKSLKTHTNAEGNTKATETNSLPIMENWADAAATNIKSRIRSHF